MKIKVKVVYEWETEVDCTVEDMKQAVYEDPFLFLQDHEPQVSIESVE